MSIKLVFTAAAVLVASVTAGELGKVGIFIEAGPDFRVITEVVPDSPAARAGVQTGDRILAVDGYPTSQLRKAEELVARGSGDAGTELELQLERRGVPFRVRMRRAVAPSAKSSPTPIPDLSGYQA